MQRRHRGVPWLGTHPSPTVGTGSATRRRRTAGAERVRHAGTEDTEHRAGSAAGPFRSTAVSPCPPCLRGPSHLVPGSVTPRLRISLSRLALAAATALASLTTACASTPASAPASAPAGETAPAATDAPRLLLLRAEHLARAKALVRAGDPRLRPAYDALVRDARAALALPRFSVTDKPLAPPGGTKHDYMSIGPYWWPDSTKPDGLPWVRRDGQVNPLSRQGMDALRFYAFVDAVETLALAYHLTDDPAYARRGALLVRAWFLDPATRMHPHLRFAQSIPGVSEGRGIGIIDSRDLPRVLDAVALLRPSGAWTGADDAGMTAWVRTFLDWLVTSENGKDEADEPNNHGVWYDAQVAPLALWVGDTARVRRIVTVDTPRRMEAQVAASGELPHETARTRPLHYSLFTIEPLQRLAEVARHVGVDLWRHRTPSGGTLLAAMRFLAPHADPANPFPKRDVSPVAPGLFTVVMRRGAAVFDDPALAAALAKLPASETTTDRSRLLYPDAP